MRKLAMGLTVAWSLVIAGCGGPVEAPETKLREPIPEAELLAPIPNAHYFRGYDTFVLFRIGSCREQEGGLFNGQVEVVDSSFPMPVQPGDVVEPFVLPSDLNDLQNCDIGDQTLFVITDLLGNYALPPFFPIRDGMVDLSGIPSQHRIEPSEVPLEEVLSWLGHGERP
ncbi:MAG: hypothetical protein DHS20C06_16470 [Hyphobacterium sp.]|nr:MAG: hypothetical protein DHS20C06_16470 [Hyphobacterium sp.]